MQHATITIRLSPSNHLFLTEVEVERLANHLHQELVCRTAAQANDAVNVTDASLTVDEAWQLIDRLESDLMADEVDWPTEGF
jgi:hypothetical protein